jgi:hypothetical protein
METKIERAERIRKEKSKEKLRKRSLLFTGVFFLLIFLSVITVMAIKSIEFKTNVSGRLKRAADASTIPLALSELNHSIKYLESKGLTKGYTSILWRTPDEDIEFFYRNLKNAQKELSEAPKGISNLESSNILMKLRETLLDHSEKGEESVTFPDGMSRYPNNGLFLILWLFPLVLGSSLIIFRFLNYLD